MTRGSWRTEFESAADVDGIAEDHRRIGKGDDVGEDPASAKADGGKVPLEEGADGTDERLIGKRRDIGPPQALYDAREEAARHYCCLPSMMASTMAAAVPSRRSSSLPASILKSISI